MSRFAQCSMRRVLNLRRDESRPLHGFCEGHGIPTLLPRILCGVSDHRLHFWLPRGLGGLFFNCKLPRFPNVRLIGAGRTWVQESLARSPAMSNPFLVSLRPHCLLSSQLQVPGGEEYGFTDSYLEDSARRCIEQGMKVRSFYSRAH